MHTPFTSRHFTTHVDPVTGMKYAVLSTHAAPIQQNFYFVNSGFSDDGRYLWFFCAFPPAAGHSVGVIDFLTDEVRHFPETLATDGWMVDPLTGNLFWGCTQGLFMRTPHPADRPIRIAPLPEAFRKSGARTIGTHLTFTPDRKEIVADLQTPIGSSIGAFDVFTGEYREWYRTTPGIPYNHAQICPADGDLCLCAHEGTFDPLQGRNVSPACVDGVYPRLQLIRRDGSRTMVPPYGNYATHECWDADGRSFYYCSKHHIVRQYLDGSEPQVVCHIPIEGGNGTWHAHASKDRRYYAVDGSRLSMGLSWWRGCESTVRFYNAETGRLAELIHSNPIVNGWTPENQSIYHIDPHPRFELNDTLIAFTVTTQGRVDLALAPVDQLIRATEKA